MINRLLKFQIWRAHIKVCKTCQRNKKQNLKYGKLTTKKLEAIPWNILSVHIIGPYKFRLECHDNPFLLKVLTMIDLSTRWFEIVQYNDQQASKISNMVNQTWLWKYPFPTIIT